MARYIDVDKAIARIEASPAFPNFGQDGYFLREVILNILDGQPTADVAPRAEVVRAICCEIEEEIVAALESNYRALGAWDDGRCNDYILEIVNRIKGKIDALRDIEGFVEELKKKYTEVEK